MPPQHGAEHCTRERGAGVNVLDENIGHVPGQYIAHDTAADAGQQADEHKKIGAAVRREVHSVPDAHDGEYTEADGVHEQVSWVRLPSQQIYFSSQSIFLPNR